MPATNQYTNRLGGDYHDTLEYRIASTAERKLINRYKKENEISDEHMFLMLYKRELDAVSKEERTKADMGSKLVLFTGFVALWSSLLMVMNGKAKMSTAVISFLACAMTVFVYAFGVLNDYRRATQRVKRLLKKMPEAPDFDDWMRKHISEIEDIDEKPRKNKRKR